jgi:cytochrome c oxidase subunit II
MTNLLHILAENQNAIDRFFLPAPSSNIAHGVDWAWNFVLGITGFFFVLVVGAMIFFIIRYRRRGPNELTSAITHNTPLEIMWTGIPTILVFVIFYIGFKGFIFYDTPQTNCRPVEVVASQWSFNFKYPNGSEDKNLYLEKDVPVVLNITSNDVLHAVYIPAFRTQRNAIMGRITQIWFIPEVLSPVPVGNDPGGFDLFCTQYCGLKHSEMGARVHVLDTEHYNKKMTELANPFKLTDPVTGKGQWIPYVEVGKKFYNQYSCSQCHTIDGSKNTGPTWKGLWKSNVTFSESNVPGFTLSPSDSDEKWEAYIHESVLIPSAKIVKDFQNQMPPQPQFAGDEANPAGLEKLRAVIEYMKSVGALPYKPRVNPKDNPELFVADEKHPNHPESLAAEKAAATSH